MKRGDLWLPHFDGKEDLAADDRHSSYHRSQHGMRFPPVRASKSVDEVSRLRKLTSLSYLSGKLRGMFHREHRDTIVCEEDEESPGSKRNIYDIIRRNESATTRFDHLAKFSDALPSARPVAFSQRASLPADGYEPSKEQRWCTNCSKCFQRGLSRYDQYCGLDCKTAHRLRQAAGDAGGARSGDASAAALYDPFCHQPTMRPASQPERLLLATASEEEEEEEEEEGALAGGPHEATQRRVR
ncbi:hypothetical protein PHYPSEUDO_012298 [Phytophthora pseudosyringae]|uniref:Uncharacterized protein n=1 Tax=Phytophthora pseudosyringae TaxID=221518 RepID=A0A8T1W3L4_9STRA|nr:hypothetical protein PHYPSEUDO_012298 [Phytophthora pseudosyringae]